MHELTGLPIGYGTIGFTFLILYFAVFRDELNAMRAVPTVNDGTG